MFRGRIYNWEEQFFSAGPFSYLDKEESINNRVFITDDLEIFIEGDSLNKIKNFKKTFYVNKGLSSQSYGVFLSTKRKNKAYRVLEQEHLSMEEFDLYGNKWDMIYKGENIGSVFYGKTIAYIPMEIQ